MKKIALNIVMAICACNTLSAQMYIELDEYESKILEQIQENLIFRGDTLFLGISPFIEILTFEKLRWLPLSKIKKTDSRYGLVYMFDGFILYKKGWFWIRKKPFFYIED